MAVVAGGEGLGGLHCALEVVGAQASAAGDLALDDAVGDEYEAVAASRWRRLISKCGVGPVLPSGG